MTQVIEGGGTRTHDLRIKSPLLYRLSYASHFLIFMQPIDFLANLAKLSLTPVLTPVRCLGVKMPPRRLRVRGQEQVLIRSTRYEQVYTSPSIRQAQVQSS